MLRGSEEQNCHSVNNNNGLRKNEQGVCRGSYLVEIFDITNRFFKVLTGTKLFMLTATNCNKFCALNTED